MNRALSAIAAAAAVAVGYSTQPAATPGRPGGAADTAAHWGAENGFVPEGARRLSATGHYLIHHFRRADGCVLSVVPLGHADEVMPLLAGMSTEQDRARARLLSVTIGPMPQGPLAVHLVRLRDRLRHGRAPQPAMLVGERDCMRSGSGDPLTSWPSP